MTSPAMPAPLRIPARYQNGLRVLAQLQDDQANRLATALSEMPPRLTTARLALAVAEEVPDLADDAQDLLEAVLSLVPLLPEDDDLAAPALAEDVARSPDLELDDDARLAFAERLIDLLSLEPVLVAARAHDVVTEFERVYHDARILTDLRPVFGANAADGAKAATVIATLKLEAHEGAGSLESYYFALDQADLLQLKSAIERALEKTAQIRLLAERMQLPYWEYKEADDATDS